MDVFRVFINYAWGTYKLSVSADKELVLRESDEGPPRFTLALEKASLKLNVSLIKR